MAVQKTQKGFSATALQKMADPLHIRIERVAPNGKTIPLDLPKRECSKEDANDIERYILHDSPDGGGGTYRGEVTDANGANFKWDFYYPEVSIPPRGKFAAVRQPAQPPMAQAPAMAPSGTVWQFQQPQSTPVTPGFPSYQQGLGQPSYPPAYMPQYPSPYYSPPQQTPVAAVNTDRSDQLRKELEEMRGRLQDESHRREREASEAKHTQEMVAIRQEFRRFTEESAKKTTSAEDPVLLAMKAQLEEMKRQNLQLQEKSEREAAETRHREEMRQMQEANKTQLDLLRKDMEGNKQNPVMQMMVENSRAQAEASKEQARLQGEAARDQARIAAEAPEKMITAMKSMQEASGMGPMLNGMANSYDSAFGLVTRNMELVNQMMMGQQGSPVANIIAEGLNGAKEVLGELVVSKQKAEIAKAHAESAASRERSSAQQAYAAAQLAAAQPQQVQQAQQTQAAVQQEVDQAAGEAEKAAEEVQSHEEQLFGILWDEVQALREHAKTKKDDPELPGEIAAAVLGAMKQLGENGIDIEKSCPAFSLLEEERHFDLFDALLPGHTSEFIGACIQAMQQ